jgi:hypothetical protein
LGFLVLAGLALSGCAENIYLTTKARLTADPGTSGPALRDYVYIAPYATKVESRAILSIVPAAPQKSADGSQPNSSGHPGPGEKTRERVEITQDKTVNGTAEKTHTVTTTEIANNDPKPVKPPEPPAQSTIVLTIYQAPTERRYLYMKRNAWFDNTVNVGIDSNGLLTQSDTSSVQEISGIVAGLAQTAFAAGGRLAAVAPLPKDAETIGKCNAAIDRLVANGAFYGAAVPLALNQPTLALPLWTDPAVGQVKLTIESTNAIQATPAGTLSDENQKGVVIFNPVPAQVRLKCEVGGNSVFLTGQQTANFYTDPEVVFPSRSFLTNPHDTYTFAAGVITAHKYTDQSAAKTIVDTVTAPVRALLPSVSVQTTTQLQTGGGKADQTTTTTQTTSAAPK